LSLRGFRIPDLLLAAIAIRAASTILKRQRQVARLDGILVSQEFTLDCAKLKALLNLVPLSFEGGYYAETHRSPEVIGRECLPPRYAGPRNISTAIYYLLEPDTFSALHRVASDEVFHFYLGDPVEMLQLWPDGSGKVVVIGADIEKGMIPQVVVPHGVWQGARLLGEGEFALLGCTVSPGFDFADYESGSRDLLSRSYPQFSEMIRALTR
jgi:predicted cupin superfamily sugar epimerase